MESLEDLIENGVSSHKEDPNNSLNSLISVEGLILRRLRRTELQRPKGVVERSRTAKRVRQSDSIPRLLAAGFFILHFFV